MIKEMISIAKPNLSADEIKAVENVIRSGILAQGKLVEDFEKEFAEYIGVKYAIATNSGTSALHTALAALNISKDDEVITTDFSFVASASCILMQNAKPVFCDINSKTYNINPELIENKINKSTKAILPVHLYGQPCKMKKIMKIANDNNLFVIEDSCQSHGAEYLGKKAGSIGDLGIFSFYPTKNMTTGEGGIITTNNKQFAEKAKIFRNHGQKKRYLHDSLGFNYRMTNIAAAIGLVQLKKLDDSNKKRKENAFYYTNNLKEIQGINPPYISPDGTHVFHQYTVKIGENFPLTRDNLVSYLQKKNIGCQVYYPIPLHDQPLFKEHLKTDEKENYPVSSDSAKKILSLPIHPGLTKNDLNYIVETIKEVER